MVRPSRRVKQSREAATSAAEAHKLKNIRRYIEVKCREMNESSLCSCAYDEILIELFKIAQSDPEYFNTVVKEEEVLKDLLPEILDMMEDAQEEEIIEIDAEGLDDESFGSEQEKQEQEEENNNKRRKIFDVVGDTSIGILKWNNEAEFLKRSCVYTGQSYDTVLNKERRSNRIGWIMRNGII
jgi:hypothetical protein